MFLKATKSQCRARVAIAGPSGSGKTYTGLIIATGLAEGGKIAVIDSERGSASKYADDFDFDVCELTTFSPHEYIKAIKEAEDAGYAAILVDSLSHAWSGIGGALEMVDNATARSRSGNSYAAWREVTPVHNALVDAMLQCRSHLVATMRSKTEYVLEEGPGGKKTPRKIGMAPVQRDGMEYEFDIFADMDFENRLIVSKTRCKALRQLVVPTPGPDFAKKILDWVTDGAPVDPEAVALAPKPTPEPSTNGKPKPAKKTKTWADCATASELAKALADMKAKHPVNTAAEKWAGIYRECIGIAATRNATGAWTEDSCDELNRVLDSVQSAINLETQSQEAFSGK
jgi:hypothetical protein